MTLFVGGTQSHMTFPGSRSYIWDEAMELLRPPYPSTFSPKHNRHGGWGKETDVGHVFSLQLKWVLSLHQGQPVSAVTRVKERLPIPLFHTQHTIHTHIHNHAYIRAPTHTLILSHIHTYHWQMVPYFSQCFLISNTKQTQFCKRLIPKEELLPQCPKLSPLLWQQNLKEFAEARDLSRTSRFPFMIFPLEKRFLFDFISWFGSYWRTVSTAPNPLNVLIFEVVTHPSQTPRPLLAL